MRIFIALEPGDEFLESLIRFLLPIKDKYHRFRWVPKENLHITLAFLGELEERLLPLVNDSVDASLGSGKISVIGGKLFTLPHRGDANVLALGFLNGGEEIASLYGKIKKNLENQGIYPGGTERKNFLPHITVARKGREPLLLL
jgi:2'-5' RNA ligase